MRNTELINEIYEELVSGTGNGGFTNPYLNTVITITKMIEEARPGIREGLPSAKRENWEKK